MKTPEQIREAIKQLYAAREGALRACAPTPPGTILDADHSKREALRNEDRQRVIILNRMIDALQWSLGEPSELSEWMQQFDKLDRIEKFGYAGRVA